MQINHRSGTLTHCIRSVLAVTKKPVDQKQSTREKKKRIKKNNHSLITETHQVFSLSRVDKQI